MIQNVCWKILSDVPVWFAMYWNLTILFVSSWHVQEYRLLTISSQLAVRSEIQQNEGDVLKNTVQVSRAQTRERHEPQVLWCFPLNMVKPDADRAENAHFDCWAGNILFYFTVEWMHEGSRTSQESWWSYQLKINADSPQECLSANSSIKLNSTNKTSLSIAGIRKRISSLQTTNT